MILALAALAHVPDATVRKILGQRSAKPLVALVWQAHLSMRTAFKIQTLVMKLAGHELLPARGGVNFPLSKEEMRWHLSYFGISIPRFDQALGIDMNHDAVLAMRGHPCEARLTEPAPGTAGPALDLERLGGDAELIGT